ncbi:MAG: cupin [Robiginitomaculum sp.]|nr:MAG: cupin [Robiginitomaculum sp.]
MEIHKDAHSFRAPKAWGAKDIALIEGASVRLHWTDKPYVWHKNDGSEVFVVLAGIVDMHYRIKGKTKIVRLEASDIFTASCGDEHVAHPVGEARILVIEKSGSI